MKTIAEMAKEGGTPLLDKLATLSDAEWDELMVLLERNLGQAMADRGLVLAPESYHVTIRLDPDKRWTAKGTVKTGDPYTYSTEGVLVTVDFS